MTLFRFYLSVLFVLVFNSISAQITQFETSHNGVFHTPIAYSINTSELYLEDSSIWSINSADAYIVNSWQVNNILVIAPNYEIFSSYDYRIVNQNTYEIVRANLQRGPTYQLRTTLWLKRFDVYQEQLHIGEDREIESVWQICSLDSSTMKEWQRNDTVIVGINDGWYASSSPNILINTRTKNHIRAKCLYQYIP